MAKVYVAAGFDAWGLAPLVTLSPALFAHRGERRLLARIEGFAGQRIEAHVVPGFQSKARPQGAPRGAGGNGKRQHERARNVRSGR